MAILLLLLFGGHCTFSVTEMFRKHDQLPFHAKTIDAYLLTKLLIDKLKIRIHDVVTWIET